MSIRKVQTEHVLQEVVRTLYSSGVKPSVGEVTTKVARHFSRFPPGAPLPMRYAGTVERGAVSNPEEYNRFLAFTAINLEVLYEVALEQLEDVLQLTSSLQSYLERLTKYRRRLEARVNDYLLSQYNTDGYFYSVSDDFFDIGQTDIPMTNAAVAVDAGTVLLPFISSKTKRVKSEHITGPDVSVYYADDSIPTLYLVPEEELPITEPEEEQEPEQRRRPVPDSNPGLGLGNIIYSKPRYAMVYRYPISRVGYGGVVHYSYYRFAGYRTIAGMRRRVLQHFRPRQNQLPNVSNPDTTPQPEDSEPEPEIIPGDSNDPLDFRTLSSFRGALEGGLDNTVWAIEVETTRPRGVVVEAIVGFTGGETDRDPTLISRIDFTPYGTTPVQVFVETFTGGGPEDLELFVFGKKIYHGMEKMIFTDNIRRVTGARFTLRKTDPDYTETSNGNTVYKYIFGAKDISFVRQVYEPSASYTSIPHFLPMDLSGDMAIDAVSLVTEADIPEDTDLKFYVAATDGTNTNIQDMNWKPIVPIDSSEPTGQKVVRFHGASHQRRQVLPNPGEGDLQLKPFIDDGRSAERNPTPNIIQATDIYRIADFEDQVLADSLSLLEGFNTTRIYHTELDENIIHDIDAWADMIKNDAPSLELIYGRIDTGDEFFFGGDIGQDSRSVYVETYLTSPVKRETLLAEFQKIDIRSRAWDVKVLLNGVELAFLPAGTDKMRLPWGFREGLNHIALIINIPQSGAVTQVQTGALSLLGGSNLYDYGEVRLDEWSFVDLFTMQYKESGSPKTFTIHNGEIISRRKPANNFLLKYMTPTGTAPEGVRFRADFTRRGNNPYISPKLEGYRLRFLYGDEEE